jgi:hypothetical protein
MWSGATRSRLRGDIEVRGGQQVAPQVGLAKV